MLLREKIQTRKLGFDRPSSKFLNFLQKYYGLKDYVPQNNNFVVFKDYFIDEPHKKDKYDIYDHNYNYSKNNYNNYDNYNNNNYSKNILTQRKLGKFNQINNNENISNNNAKNDEKEFASKIYREYYNKPNEEVYQKENEQKKSFGYNQYQSTSSEYGAFFHMNK